MTDRSFGHSLWYGVVTDVNDPDQEGRVRVRIHGLYDDTTNIPDDHLPWVKPCQDITSAGHNKIGKLPVGVIKGTTVGGYFLDGDKQYPVFHHVIAKAGDPQEGTTVNGQTELVPGTNSNPIADRNKNNAFVTRKGKNIKEEDNATEPPKESNDSEGVDITADAQKNTKYATQPTVASLSNPIGSILNQLTSIDPTHLTSVLPNAVDSLTKIKDLNTFSTTAGVNNVLGQVLGLAMNTIGAARFLNALSANSPTQQPTTLSATSQHALLLALQNLGPAPSSDMVLSVIGSVYEAILPALLALIDSGNLTEATLDALLLEFFANIQNQGANDTIGGNINSVLNNLQAMLPQLTGPIQSTMNSHLPASVLNQSSILTALQKFALNQSFLKKPTDGKKDLAIKATTPGTSGATDSVNNIPGVSDLSKKYINSLTSLT